ncbi:MAG TPA: HAD family phosphatase [Candidatus Saccharimonadales bacterium]|nr:HAD family phosphatase [Candidatus Saccharimonadales bacterium]
MIYRTILFDMNGVIVDDEPLHMVAFNEVVKQYGFSISDEVYNAYFAGRTDEDGFRLYFDSLNAPMPAAMAELLNQKAAAYQKLAKGKLQPFPGVIEFIKSLAADKNLTLALVTSSLHVEAETVLNAFEISSCFKALVTADDITKGKPNPEGYLKGAAAVNAKPEECLVIEDAPSGIMAAHNAGMKCVAVLNTYSRDELKEADLIVEKLVPGCLDTIA